MLSIGQLASYAGVTVKAVRHYHRVGLLAEPPRDRSGYRAYDAAAVVTLIRIRTLAEAGVPLARVHQLLNAGPDEFASEMHQIDEKLRAEVRRLQRSRERIRLLASEWSLALPPSVTSYLERLRLLGVDDRIIRLERDGWIMIAAQIPDEIEAAIAQKEAELNDPDMVELYLLMSEAIDWAADDPRAEDIADILERLMERSLASGEADGPGNLDDGFVNLLDATTLKSAPIAASLFTTLEHRGWRGWTRVQRIDSPPPAPWRE